jgi:hypothetical protein
MPGRGKMRSHSREQRGPLRQNQQTGSAQQRKHVTFDASGKSKKHQPRPAVPAGKLIKTVTLDDSKVKRVTTSRQNAAYSARAHAERLMAQQHTLFRSRKQTADDRWLEEVTRSGSSFSRELFTSL